MKSSMSKAIADDSEFSEAPVKGGGRRKRAAAFSYSRVRVDKPTQLRTAGLRTKSDTDDASTTTDGSGERDMMRSTSYPDFNNGTSSTATTSSTASSIAETTDGRDVIKYDFVDELPDDCCCGMCGELMEEPLQTQCCKTDYCQPCLCPDYKPSQSEIQQKFLSKFIKPSLKSSGVECPDCNSPNVKLKMNEDLKKKVSSLQVKCIFASAGCVWEGEKVWLNEHLDKDGGCVYASVICSKCGMQLRRKDERHHSVAECDMRKVHCQYCHRSDTYAVITKQHVLECPNYPVKCTLDCGEIIPRHRLQNHIDKDCASKGIQCPFKSLGCTKSPIPADDLENHMTSCGVLHIGAMMKRFTAQIESLQAQVQTLHSDNESLRQEVSSLSATMETTNATIATLKLENKANTHTLLSEMEYYCTAREPHQLIALECMKTQLISDYIQLQAGGSPATIRMTSYTNHKDSGQVWLSPPFFVCAGYKLRLGVHLNGVGAGKGSHVSIYLHHMAGERDEYLEWPYLIKDRVKVSLLKQSDTNSTPTTTGQATTKGFGRRVQCPVSTSSSLDSPTLDSLPHNASPLRQRRRILDNPRNPPLKDADETTLVVIETQALSVSKYLRRVSIAQNSLGGVVVSKVELFCTQSCVADAVYYDSLVFQCTLCSANLCDGSITCT